MVCMRCWTSYVTHEPYRVVEFIVLWIIYQTLCTFNCFISDFIEANFERENYCEDKHLTHHRSNQLTVLLELSLRVLQLLALPFVSYNKHLFHFISPI